MTHCAQWWNLVFRIYESLALRLRLCATYKYRWLLAVTDAENGRCFFLLRRSLRCCRIWSAVGVQLSNSNTQKVNKAENQLMKDVDVLVALLAGLSSTPRPAILSWLFCLQNILCTDCPDNGVICQEDLNNMSLLHYSTTEDKKMFQLLAIMSTECLEILP